MRMLCGPMPHCGMGLQTAKTDLENRNQHDLIRRSDEIESVGQCVDLRCGARALDQLSSRSFPVVFRPSNSRCACAASRRGYVCSMRSFKFPARIIPNTAAARACNFLSREQVVPQRLPDH